MFATILLPNFYLQGIARHQPKLRDQPLAVLDDTVIKAVILQLNEAAENEGVRAGMAPSQALARCLHLVIKARARDCEQQISDILLHHAFMLSPFVEATAPGVCTVQFMESCSSDRWSGENPDALTEKLRCVIDLLARCDFVEAVCWLYGACGTAPVVATTSPLHRCHHTSGSVGVQK